LNGDGILFSKKSKRKPAMKNTDPRIDAYISKSADFAKPIMLHLRTLVHKACPQVEEGMKWSFPHFMYKGKILCSMASFKQHCTFGFWRRDLQLAAKGNKNSEPAMGQFGRITRLADLPNEKLLLTSIKQAMRLQDTGAKPPAKARPKTKTKLKIPNYFVAALKRNKHALATFENFSYTNKKDYLEWITEAKTGETRAKRLATAVEWMAEGKIRNWKYLKNRR